MLFDSQATRPIVNLSWDIYRFVIVLMEFLCRKLSLPNSRGHDSRTGGVALARVAARLSASRAERAYRLFARTARLLAAAEM